MSACMVTARVLAYAHLDEEWRSSVEDILCTADGIVKGAICQQVRLKQLQSAWDCQSEPLYFLLSDVVSWVGYN